MLAGLAGREGVQGAEPSTVTQPHGRNLSETTQNLISLLSLLPTAPPTHTNTNYGLLRSIRETLFSDPYAC